jgi:hypothetical protein
MDMARNAYALAINVVSNVHAFLDALEASIKFGVAFSNDFHTFFLRNQPDLASEASKYVQLYENCRERSFSNFVRQNHVIN